MTFLKYSIIVSFLLLACETERQTQKQNVTKIWNGKTAAIVLTYDDGLNVHLDHVAPVLDSHEIKATFYVHTNSESFKKRKKEWKSVADSGHELGNHTVFHPCAGQSKNRDWVLPEKDLDNYTYASIINEIKTASNALGDLDGRTARTYAYTCGDTSILDTSYIAGIKEIFPCARGVQRAYNHKDSIDLYKLKAHSMKGHNADEMISIVDKAIENESLLIFLFHGVGGDHHLNVEAADHDLLIEHIKSKESELWVTTMIDVSGYIEDVE